MHSVCLKLSSSNGKLLSWSLLVLLDLKKTRWTTRKGKKIPMYIVIILLGICGQSLKTGIRGCFLRIPDVSQMLKNERGGREEPNCLKIRKVSLPTFLTSTHFIHKVFQHLSFQKRSTNPWHSLCKWIWRRMIYSN